MPKLADYDPRPFVTECLKRIAILGAVKWRQIVKDIAEPRPLLTAAVRRRTLAEPAGGPLRGGQGQVLAPALVVTQPTEPSCPPRSGQPAARSEGGAASSEGLFMNCQQDDCDPAVFEALQAAVRRSGPARTLLDGGPPPPPLPPTGGPTFGCRWCGKRWTSARARMMHEASSHGRRSWCSDYVCSDTCIVCGKVFHCRSRVIRHLNGSGCGAIVRRGLVKPCDPAAVASSEAGEAARARRARTAGIAPLAAWPPGPPRGGPGVFRFLREAEQGV